MLAIVQRHERWLFVLCRMRIEPNGDLQSRVEGHRELLQELRQFRPDLEVHDRKQLRLRRLADHEHRRQQFIGVGANPHFDRCGHDRKLRCSRLVHGALLFGDDFDRAQEGRRVDAGVLRAIGIDAEGAACHDGDRRPDESGDGQPDKKVFGLGLGKVGAHGSSR